MSAYESRQWCEWKTVHDGTLVLEGFEVWIREALQQGMTLEEVKKLFFTFVEDVRHAGRSVVFILLETGRGIVPMEKLDRDGRDLLGWLTQKLTGNADEVTYCWHGLWTTLKA
ncbi:UNVERIFIED_CONTAM: bifunctional adenosylcobinamide kinase/adenosylcobinamide-phosphate guanylyltransferase [Halobacillus marinus]